MAKRKSPRLHDSIKECLGYDLGEPDEQVWADWRERTRRVCKPCWELKYCPYGPLVEQSPLLPLLKGEIEDQIARLEKSLETGVTGDVYDLDTEEVEMRKAWLEDEDLLLVQAWSAVKGRKVRDSIVSGEQSYNGALPPIEQYRVKFNLGLDYVPSEEDFPPEVWNEIIRERERIEEGHRQAVESRQIDTREQLTRSGRAFAKRRLRALNPMEHPPEIPAEITDARCQNFGHICPVFFTAEVMTETQDERRIGRRALNFSTMMRIVRRDDYRCQHCGKQLQDDEVEFDHIIPVAKGGSSEEHNIRLTCFDCNRDKSDHYEP